MGYCRLFELCFLLSSTYAVKQRSWLGPKFFVEGTLPSPTSGHGFTSADTKLYMFGGLSGSASQKAGQAKVNLL